MKPHEIYDTEIDKLLDNIGGDDEADALGAALLKLGQEAGSFSHAIGVALMARYQSIPGAVEDVTKEGRRYQGIVNHAEKRRALYDAMKDAPESPREIDTLARRGDTFWGKVAQYAKILRGGAGLA